MRVLYLYAHPLPESFHAAIRGEALAGLAAAGHQVDLLDLYAEDFDPVMSAEGRRKYHDTSRNREGLETHAQRLTTAEAIVVQFPVWSFGLPAILKGYFDRMFMPGVAFDLGDPNKAKPLLGNIGKIAAITTYGRPRYMAFVVGDPPRKTIKRYLRWFIAPRARIDYHALYNMNIASEAKRKAFIASVHAAMARF